MKNFENDFPACEKKETEKRGLVFIVYKLLIQSVYNPIWLRFRVFLPLFTGSRWIEGLSQRL